jgi:arylsulfatase A-like enzyme
MSRRILFALTAALVLSAAAEPARKPNILILYIDDMGFADLSATGNKQLPTPNIDSLATNGARFSDSYVTSCVCSPSRAALLTGRYQQRFGFDANAEGRSPKDKFPRALDLHQTIWPQRLKPAGYATAIFGKWHVGDQPGYLPNDRGFDEFYGILPFGLAAQRDAGGPTFYRNKEKTGTPPDATIALEHEAVSFIERHKDQPWFVDMAFTSVHGPHYAPDEYLKKFQHIKEVPRRTYCAMLSQLDDTIGRLLEKLRQLNLEENTLIFCASDNGGPGGACDNTPFQGTKWTLWEGGVRSPIFIQWKGHIPPGRTLHFMTTQLDWLPTACAAAGIEPQPDWHLDGANILPQLEGKSDAAPHDALYFRFGIQYAVREGDWKLVKPSIDDAPELFNVAADPGEKTDLAARHPDKVQHLQALWDEWNVKNEPPRWIDNRWNGIKYMQAAKGTKKGKSKKQ